MREFRCARLGFHCSWRHIATEQLLAEMAALHLRDVHGLKMIDPVMVHKIKNSFSEPLTKEAAAAAQAMKEYNCDLHPGCEWRYLAMSADLIADGAAVHARSAHGIKVFTPEMIARVKNSIREWSGPKERNAA